MKKLRFLLLLLLVASTVLSCTPKGGDAENNSAEETGTAAVIPSLHLIENGKTAYQIIYPDTGDASALKAATEFKNLFVEKTGVVLDTGTDYLPNGKTHDEDVCKILIGKTNYPESAETYKGVGYYDYRIKIVGTHLVIVAYQDSAYDAALKWLEENAFSALSGNKEADALIIKTEAQSGSVKKPSDTLTEWKIAGVSLDNYKIVYDAGIDAKTMEDFRLELAKKSGYYLEMQPDDEAELSDYEILIGETNREESADVENPQALHYTFRVLGSKLVVKASGAHSLAKVLTDFVPILAQDSKKLNMTANYEWTDNFFDDPNDIVTPDGTDLRLMTANVMANIEGYNNDMRKAGFDFDRCAEIFYAMLDFYQPTVIGLQECCMAWNRAIKEYEDFDKWELLEFQNPNLKNEFVMSTIMYRKDLLTLVDSDMQYYSAYSNGRCRCITWAVFRDNATGKEFCFASTHWDGGAAEDGSEMPNTMVQVAEMTAFVNEMAKKYPVFTTGDFNRNEYTVAFKKYLADTNSVDCMYAAEKRLNELGSYHGWGTATSSAGSCDHITATKNIKVLLFETLIYNEQVYASDHSWLIADIQFQ